MKTKAFSVVAALLLIAGFAQAMPTTGLTINIDTNANELWFSGLDNVTPFGMFNNSVMWTENNDRSGSRVLDISSAFSVSGLAHADLTYYEAMNDLNIMLYFNSAAAVTLATTDTHINYSSFFTAQEVEAFESIIPVISGTTIPVMFNSSSNELKVNFVPEPCTMALLGLGGLVLRRRK